MKTLEKENKTAFINKGVNGTANNGKTDKSGAPAKEEVKGLPAEQEVSGIKPKTAESESRSSKSALNLEATLKVVGDLHRRSIQRDNLLSRIRQLEAFEIAQMEESDELESNHFQGCQLIIGDDKGRKFITQTAGLIKLTAEFIRTACIQKLGEIEADIVLPKS